MKTGVVVEKLLPAKIAKIKSRQDALQTSFSVFLDVFHPSNFRCFDENGVFQQPRLFTTIDSRLAGDSPIALMSETRPF
jgi:hypothetical protein